MNNLKLKDNLLFYCCITLVALVVIYFEFPFIQNSTSTPKWVILSFLALFFITVINRKPKYYLSKNLLIWVLFIIVYTIGCFVSYNFWDSLVNTIPFILSPILILSLKKPNQDITSFYNTISIILNIILFPLLIIITYKLITLIYTGNYSHSNTYQFSFSFGHRNQLSQFITLVIPLLLISNNKKLLLLKITTVLLIYIDALLLMNKTVFLILFGIYPFVLLLYVINRFSKKIKLITLSMILLIVSASIFTIYNYNINNTSFIGKLYTTDYGSGNERARIWKNSLDLVKENPFFGYGSGDWKIEILNTPLRFTQAEQSKVYYKRAHNDFIQVFVENGIIGLVLLITFFVLSIYYLFKSEIASKNKYLLFSGLLGFFVVANLSFPLEKIELLFLLFLFILPTYTRPALKSKSLKKFSLVILSVYALSLSSVWIYYEYKYFKCMSSNNSNKLNSINCDFYSITPTVLPTYSQIGAYYFLNKDYALAISNYKKALKFNPYHVHVLNDLGSSYYASGKIELAEFYYQKALEINPVFTESIMNYTSLKFNNGDIDGALNMVLTVVIGWEPENYKTFITTIAKAKCQWLIELHDEPKFESFLYQAMTDENLLYHISVNSRKSGACYEDELRIYFSNL